MPHSLVTAAHRIALAAALLVPRGQRADFRAEWDAEIAWAAANADGGGGQRARIRQHDILQRALGAFVHALWLRQQQWSSDMLWQDIRYAARVLLRRPAFTIVAALTLALGIGANTAIFSIVYRVLLEPLPFHEPARLVQIWETNPLRNWTDATASPANLLDWRQRNRVFEGIAFYPGMDERTPMYANRTLSSSRGEPERLRTLEVSVNFFEVLGVAPALGRQFTSGEDVPGHNRVAILSDGAWRAYFQADPAVIGRDIDLNARPYRVIGVAPPSFAFPTPDAHVYTPFVMAPGIERVRRPHYLRPIARMKAGVTIDQARADLQRIAAELEREYPDTNTRMGADLGSLHEWVVGAVRRPLLVFLGAVALVLLVACANLANLLLARAVGRTREFAVRAALGGDGWRLARQSLTESALLAGAGGVLGIGVARWALDAIVTLSPAGLPRLEEAAVDAWMLVFVAALTAAVALLFGLAPAWHGAHADLSALRDGTRATAARLGTRRVLVIGQIALSVALVLCAGLLLRSFLRLQAVPPGFDPENVVTFKLTLPGVKYGDDAKVVRFFDELVTRIRAIPGVVAAGGSTVLGLEGMGWTGDLFVEKRPEFHGRELGHKYVTEGYFEAVGLPILRGRSLTAADDATRPPAVVVNETFARQYFGGEEAVGQRISYSYDPAQRAWDTIVGVVRDEKQSGLADRVKPSVYGTFRQNASSAMTLAVRTSGPAAGAVTAIREALRAEDAGIAMYDVRTLQLVVSASVARERFIAWIVAVFAALALAIAAVGVYGVVSYSVNARTQEIGVRIALGATRGGIMRLVLGEAFTMLAAGAAAGFVISLAAGGAIRSLLFETTPADPLTCGVVAGVLIVVGLAASCVPLRRALALDPVSALRYE